MALPYEYLLGWRYIRAGRSTRHNGFISFISAASIIGIALGVAALIIVLSVMNGFQKEVRDRMLGVVSHAEVSAIEGNGLSDADAARLVQRLQQQPHVLGAAPFINGQALIVRGDVMQGVMVRGIAPEQEAQVSDVAARHTAVIQQLHAGSFQVVLGVQLAHMLGVMPGDTITLVVPGGQMTPAGLLPRLKQVQVAGTFDTQHFEYNASLLMMHVDDAARLFQLEGPMGVRLRLDDLHQAPHIAQQLQHALGMDYVVEDWTQKNRTWFAAVKVEKAMMFIILTLIVAVAAFNLVSTLVMSVQDKRADIAILRTLGAAPRSIMKIFMVQGALAGIMGTVAGLILGLTVALNIDVIVPFLENLLQVKFLPQDIYFISTMPSDPRASDIVPVVVVSLVLSFLATLYPSWRASQVNPAEALRYE